MTYREAIVSGEKSLCEAGIADARNDAWLLLTMACKIDHTYYYMHIDEEMPEHFSENVIKAGAMNRNSWNSKNIIGLRYCWDSMWQSRFFCTILRETCQKPERWQTAHDKTGFQKSWTGASEY